MSIGQSYSVKTLHMLEEYCQRQSITLGGRLRCKEVMDGIDPDNIMWENWKDADNIYWYG